MVTKRKSPTTSVQVLTAQRAARLCKLLRLLRDGPQTRTALIRRLHLDVRGFYRDLEWLRSFGISVLMANGRYYLDEDADKVIARLPFPDPQLTLGEATQLAKGRSTAHRKLKQQIARILP
jgi:predicted DNA-binding transcriptional regulator YafY